MCKTGPLAPRPAARPAVPPRAGPQLSSALQASPPLPSSRESLACARGLRYNLFGQHEPPLASDQTNLQFILVPFLLIMPLIILLPKPLIIKSMNAKGTLKHDPCDSHGPSAAAPSKRALVLAARTLKRHRSTTGCAIAAGRA